jgi:hypothetical protein
MNKPILPLPVSNHPDAAATTSGEGAQTALAAMIRKRRMGENHVETDPPEPLEQHPSPDN